MDGRRVRECGWAVVCGVVLWGGAMRAQAGDPPLKKQLPADERAYKAAQTVHDPAQRLAAMRSFVAAYPKSSRSERARSAILTILLKNFPERAGEIRRQVRVVVKSSGEGLSRSREESYLAFQMAEAGTNGVDLKTAETLAKDAVKRTDAVTFDRETTANYVKYKAPVPKAAEMHADFANTRADMLAVVADVDLRMGRKSEAEALTTEAYALDPMVDDVNTMRGRLALADGKNAEAMEGFERAQMLGTIPVADRAKLAELYRAAHGGSADGLEAELDARYRGMFPPAFRPGPVKAVTGGHTVLVELFTGSGCEPCVGGDMAVEGMLEAYPRSEVVALAFDEHIPEPDPLANADSVARAGVYDVTHTPSYVVDGRVQEIYGGSRSGSEELYRQLTKVVDAEAARPTGVGLGLSAERTGGVVRAKARVTLPGVGALATAVSAGAAGTAAEPVGNAAGAAAAAPAAAAPEVVVNFALVEDEVRYSGENGVRFHRMVVRSLARAAGTGFPVEAGGSAAVEAAFDPAAISQGLREYLETYEKGNDRFGTTTFRMTDTAMDPRHLLVAAWVQDAVSHRVLATALMPLSAEAGERGGQ